MSLTQRVDRATRGDEQPRRRLRFALAVVTVAVVAGVTASAAWSYFVIVDYYGQDGNAAIIQPATTVGDGGYNNMHSSEVMAMQSQTSIYTCSGCLVNGFMSRPNGFQDCNITDYGYVSCHLNPGQTVYARAFCRNPHQTSSRWFHCWKFIQA